MSGLLAFLSGSIFRMMWGEIATFITKYQDHKHELEFTKLQGDIAKTTHANNLEALKLQHDLGIEHIYVQQEVATDAGELDAWVSTVKSLNTPTGTGWIDKWNQSIRPAVASLAMVALVVEIFLLGHLTDFHHEVFGAALGLFLADRALSKRGK